MEDIVIRETPEYLEALKITATIKANAAVACDAMVAVCQDLKRMRDERLYTAMGFDKFDDYVEQEVGIKARQAYNYISTYERLGDTVLQSNASLGITKLALLAQAPAADRPELLENEEIAGMSVREVKDLVEKCKQQGEQISLLENQQQQDNEGADMAIADEADKRREIEDRLAAATKRIEELKSELEDANDTVDLKSDLAREEEARAEAERQLREAREKIAEMKKQPADEAEIERIRKMAEKEAEEAARGKIKAEIEKARAAALKEAEQKIATARKEGEKAGKKQAAGELQPIAEEKARLEQRARELEKKLEVAENKETVLFAHLFEEMQNNFERLLQLLGKMDAETAQKFHSALQKYLGMMDGRLKDGQ